MTEPTTYVGLDVHKREIHVAMLVGHARTPQRWQLANEPRAVRALQRKLEREAPGPVLCYYEAGVCGYALQRAVTHGRIHCQVIAPALVPRKPGERVKTDPRDAGKLAELGRAGLLTPVHPPTEAEEAVRDLCRARDAVRRDLLRVRHRVSKLLLRRGRPYAGRQWSGAHQTWLRAVAWEQAADQVVFNVALLALDQLEARLAALDGHLRTVADTEPYRTPVGWLRCFRGIDTLTAVTLVAELHGVARFPSARALMAYLGLVPSEHSSGERHARGRITRTGNGLVRRLLVEAGWHYQFRARTGQALQQRRQGQPTWVIGIADRAQTRLCSRFRRLALHKARPKVVVAIARELAGFIWATLQPPHTA